MKVTPPFKLANTITGNAMSDITASFLMDSAKGAMSKANQSSSFNNGKGPVDHFASVLDKQTRASQVEQSSAPQEKVSSATPKPSNQASSRNEPREKAPESSNRVSDAPEQRANEAEKETQASHRSGENQSGDKERHDKEHAEGRGPEQAAKRMAEKTEENVEPKAAEHAASLEKGQETSSEKHSDILAMLLARVQEKHPDLDLSKVDQEALLAEVEGEHGEELLADLSEVVDGLVATAVDGLQDLNADNDKLAGLAEAVVVGADREVTPEVTADVVHEEAPVVAEALMASMTPQQVVEDIQEAAVAEPEVTAKSQGVNPLANAVRQNVEKTVKPEPTPLETEIDLESPDELMMAEAALEKVLERLELQHGKTEAVLSVKEALSRPGNAAEFLEQLTSRVASESGTESRSLIGAMNAANAAGGLRGGAPVAQQVLSTPLSSPDWGSAFAKRISFFVRNDMQHAELRLDPPEMGRVNIRINITQDQASLHIITQHANVKDVIEQTLPKLREMLAESGLNLANADVSTQLANQQKQPQNEAGGRLAGPAFPGDNEESVEESGAAARVIESDSLVDFYA